MTQAEPEIISNSRVYRIDHARPGISLVAEDPMVAFANTLGAPRSALYCLTLTKLLTPSPP